MKVRLNETHWSRYNRLFRNGEHGGLLYNILSNILFELDEPHYTMLESWCDKGIAIAAEDEEFLNLLREKNVIIDSKENERFLHIYQYEHLATCFDTSLLGLTICPTLRCNFRCPY